MNNFVTIFTVLSLLFIGCQKDGHDSKSREGAITITVNPNKTYQTIDGFGASDAWRVQFVGKNWPLEKREAMADLLFSQEVDSSGNPEGIGLSIWRFYIGAGSKEQGKRSGISNEWRRAPSFLDAEGNWDWSEYEGQRWFLNAAQKRNVNQFLAFTISPPVFMTKNGKAYSPGGIQMNIQEGKLDDYADFLVEIIDHFLNQENLTFDYLSPINEPQWDWDDGGQEGTPATNKQMHKFVKLISERLSKRELPTQIVLGEAAKLQFLSKKTNDRPLRSDQIATFFDSTSKYYIGGYPNVKHTISGHSYFTTWPIDMLINQRKKLASRLNSVDSTLGYWQSEFCILQKNDDITGGNERDLGMDTALYVARVIHYDLTIANARSWQWWTALTQADYKDGLLYLDAFENPAKYKDSNKQGVKYNGVLHDSKLLWALGNYSRFVRPGMKRVDVDNPKEKPYGLMVSAYKDNEKNKLAIVFVNYSDEKKPVYLKLNNGSLDGEQFETYTTSSTMELEKRAMHRDSLVIPSRSVLTVVTKIK